MTGPDDRDEVLEDETYAGEEEQRFDLADEGEELPWLEADEYEEESGFDTRLILYAVVGLAVVALLLALIWYTTRGGPDPDLVPDGSTIEAPEGAYKQRPDDAGGAQVEGTGDQAFQVAEGQQDRGRIDAQDGGGSPRPSIDREQDESSTGESEAEEPAPSGAVYVQIGAFGSEADAQSAWSSATQRYSVLSGLRKRIVDAEVNGAKVYRLQAATGSRDAAESTCRAIRNGGGDCYIR